MLQKVVFSEHLDGRIAQEVPVADVQLDANGLAAAVQVAHKATHAAAVAAGRETPRAELAQGRAEARGRDHQEPQPALVLGKALVVKRGVRDGRVGLAIAALSAMNTFVKHAKVWELQRRK